MNKVKIAVAWNSSCGGCDESIVDLETKILDIVPKVEFALWPCAMDFKYDDVKKMEDNEITVSLINGGIQNTHQKMVVELLRKKSKIIVAFGSCACMGGIPSLANLTNINEIFDSSYISSPSVVNPDKILPQTECSENGYKLHLPEIFKTLYKLDDIIYTDYYLPGCPPTASMIADAIGVLLSGKLPPKKTIIAPNKALCASCSRNESKPENITIKEIKRIHEINADPDTCFLAQGVICMGPATRDGCDYPCIKGNMPCTGCMGPVSNADQGSKMIGTLGGILDGENEESVNSIIDKMEDPAGTFYRYCVSGSILGKERK